MPYRTRSGIEGRNVSRRISWLIIDVIHRNKMTNATFAEVMNVHKKSITNYRGMATTPDMMFILKMVELFGVNVEWVHIGKGEPYGKSDGEEEEEEEE